MNLHPVIEGAARGELPPWARLGKGRRAHVERVADLLEEWARARGLAGNEAVRWRGAGMLHDALRDEDPETLRTTLPPELADFPAAMIHGPAAAQRLRDEGVDDPELLRAVAYHSSGHPEPDQLGRFLYLADFLEPGRSFRSGWRAELRARVLDETEDVLREVVRTRIGWALDRGLSLRRETLELWNGLVREPSSALRAAR